MKLLPIQDELPLGRWTRSDQGRRMTAEELADVLQNQGLHHEDIREELCRRGYVESEIRNALQEQAQRSTALARIAEVKRRIQCMP